MAGFAREMDREAIAGSASRTLRRTPRDRQRALAGGFAVFRPLFDHAGALAAASWCSGLFDERCLTRSQTKDYLV